MEPITLKTIHLFLLVFVTSGLLAAGYKVDPSESQFKWTAKKVTGQHFGTIDLKQGSLTASGNVISVGSFEIDMKTIVDKDLENESWNSKLVEHLKSEDFFSVEKFPVSSITLTKVEKGEGLNFHFSGDLSIKGATHPVSFDATVEINNVRLVATGNLSIDRTLYDIKYGSGKFFSNLGNNLVDDFFTLDFKIVANQIPTSNKSTR
jgi:polyisoprenoid-binding protein YceI